MFKNHGMSEQELNALWESWQSEKKTSVRNQLFEHYFPWSRKVASSLFVKYRHHLLEWNEVVNIVSLAMLDCIQRYDTKAGIPFEGYSYPRLKGSLLNTISDLTKNSSSAGYDELYNGNSLESEVDSFDAIIDATVEMAMGLFLQAGAIASIQEDELFHAYQNDQITNILTLLVDQLGENERFVIKGYYFQQLAIKDIASILDVSSARVSQLHKKSLKSLRELYERNY